MANQGITSAAANALNKRIGNIWHYGRVYTKALGFGPDAELLELQAITIRPDETQEQSLIRHGYNPKESRIEIVD